jgi:hypothetical protein
VSSENTGMDIDSKENCQINETEKDTVTKEKFNSGDEVLGHSESSSLETHIIQTSLYLHTIDPTIFIILVVILNL